MGFLHWKRKVKTEKASWMGARRKAMNAERVSPASPEWACCTQLLVRLHAGLAAGRGHCCSPLRRRRGPFSMDQQELVWLQLLGFQLWPSLAGSDGAALRGDAVLGCSLPPGLCPQFHSRTLPVCPLCPLLEPLAAWPTHTVETRFSCLLSRSRHTGQGPAGFGQQLSGKQLFSAHARPVYLQMCGL